MKEDKGRTQYFGDAPGAHRRTWKSLEEPCEAVPAARATPMLRPPWQFNDLRVIGDFHMILYQSLT